MERSLAGYEVLDHTAEVILRVWASDLGGLLEQAAHGFVSLVPEHVGRVGNAELREIRIGRADPPRMLADWLNELVYLAEVERWLPTDVEIDEDAGPGLSVRMHGMRLERPFVLVKAATLHDLTFDASPDGIQAEVTLDI